MRHKIAAVFVTAFLCVAGAVSTGHASTTVGGPQEGTTGYYDYTPHGMRTSTTETEIWCGDTSSHTVDTILEQQYTLSNWSLKVPERTAFQEGPAGSWDDTFTCNPSNVIQGNFVNVLGDGVTYNYVVYYIGYGSSTKVNQIGAAYSVDGLNWHKYPTPVESYPTSSCGCYGYSQPNAVSIGGVISLYFEDNPNGTQVFHDVAVSTDGAHFAPFTAVSNTGFSTLVKPNWGSLAYNPANLQYYVLLGEGWRPPSQTGGVQEAGDNGCVIYTSSDPTLGNWTEIDTIDTNLTGYEVNFLCGFVTDYNGNLSPDLQPSIKILTSASYPRPAYNASPTDLSNSAVFNNWQIMWATYTPGNSWKPLQRVDYSPGHHEVTTGWYDSSVYHLENINLGKLAEAPTGSATVPLYGCKFNLTNYFVSLDAGCEGQYKLGVEGYLYSTPAADRTAIYRCNIPGHDHFVSTDPNCEGQTTEFLLGYSQN